MNKLSLYKILTLLCVTGITAILLFWYIAGYPYSSLPLKERIMVLVFLIIPLWFCIQGMIRNKLYTYKWSTLLVCLYFIHGVMESWANPAAQWLALTELALSLGWFVFSIMWVRSYREQSSVPD